MASLEELFRKEITLTYEGMDRILLNGYIPSLQTPAGVANFFLNRRSHPAGGDRCMNSRIKMCDSGRARN